MPETTTHAAVNETSRTQKSALTSVKVTERPIRPHRRLLIGTSLAFCIQERAIDMAAASHSGLASWLSALEKVYIPGNLTDAEQRQNFISKQIAKFKAAHGKPGARISIVIGARETAVRTLLLPKLRRKDLNSAVTFEVRKQLPFPIDDSVFGFRTSALLTVGKTQKFRIAAFAATKRMLDEHLEPFARIGARINEVVVGKDVLGQLFRQLPDFSQDESYALVNIGYEYSEVAFYRGTDLEFTHTISLGTSFFANRSDSVVFEYFSESLAGEIQNALDYYSGQFSQAFSNRVYISGDLSFSDELIGFLSDRFGFRFETFPISHLQEGKHLSEEIKRTVPACLEVVAVALNQRSFPNLLPAGYKQAALKRRIDRWGISALCLLLLTLLTQWQLQRSGLASQRNELAAIRRQITSFQQSRLFNTYTRLKLQLQKQEQYAAQTKPITSVMGLNLKELSRLTPPQVRLYELNYRKSEAGKNMHLSGVITSQSTPPEIILAEYVELLKDSPFYDDIIVRRHVKKQQGKEFRLEFNLDIRGVS